MAAESLKENLKQVREIIREIYIFTNQLNIIKNLETNSRVVINTKEKKLLYDAITALTNQLRILNNAVPPLVQAIGFYKKLTKEGAPEISTYQPKEKLVQVKYQPSPDKEKISLTIGDKERKEFLENLSKSNLSITQLKNKYAVERPIASFGKPNAYAKLSNHFFRNIANQFVLKGSFDKLNKDLRKMNSPFVLGTYVSMLFFTVFLTFIISLILFVFLLFFKVNLLDLANPFPLVTEPIFLRFINIFWIVIVLPLVVGLIMYIYPKNEAKTIGAKIDQELPFVAIHMSAIATSGVDPLSIFKIILKSEEYKYSNSEFRKLMNLINFHGQDLVTALKRTASSSPSKKLRELLDGLATAITSGGLLHDFLDKHSEGLLFDYKLEREKYTKTSETFMDIYISIVIAAPMILLMLFVIMGSTCALSDFIGLSTNALAFLIILGIVVLNIGFLIFLRIKQPVI